MGRIHASGVVDGLRFEQHDPRLFFGNGTMFHSSWDQNHASLLHDLCPVAKVHGHLTFEDEKQFVFLFVGVPNELPKNFGNLDVLPIQRGHHPRVPVVFKEVKFGGEIDRDHGVVLLALTP